MKLNVNQSLICIFSLVVRAFIFPFSRPNEANLQPLPLKEVFFTAFCCKYPRGEMKNRSINMFSTGLA